MDGYMHFVKTQIALSKGLTQRLSQVRPPSLVAISFSSGSHLCTHAFTILNTCIYDHVGWLG